MDPRIVDELTALGDWDVPPDLHQYVATEHQRLQLRKVIAELENRKTESLRLFEPSPFQASFLACTAKEAVLQKGNQAGGTTVGAVEMARCLTGQDPFGKYAEKDGVAVVVGFKEDHIGMVIYRYLFMPGAFRIIKDNGDWRVFRPWQDKGRESEAMPAPPLIPSRFIKEIVWEKRAKRIFKSVYFTTGWELKAFSSRANPAQGFCASLVWFDEDLERDDWYDEMVARLSMSPEKTGKKGLLRWTALPHSRNEALVKLVERAEDEAGKLVPETVAIKASIFDNPFMDEKTRQDNIRIWLSQGEDEYRKRALGELTVSSSLMYPEFNDRLHSAVRKAPEEGVEDTRPLALKLLAENNYQPPADWCRYVAVDPGHQRCAVLFVAIPPPALGDFVIAYDELYLSACDARKFGDAFAFKAKDQTFQRFIIDMHGGNLRDLASGQMPHEQYAERLREHGISSVETRHGFQPGCDDVDSRTLLLHEWLYVRREGNATFLVVNHQCPNLLTEFRRFKKVIIKNVITDKPNTRTPCHLIQCAEYLAAGKLTYKRPKLKTRKTTHVDTILAGRRDRERQRKHRNFRPGKSTISLGPTGG